MTCFESKQILTLCARKGRTRGKGMAGLSGKNAGKSLWIATLVMRIGAVHSGGLELAGQLVSGFHSRR